MLPRPVSEGELRAIRQYYDFFGDADDGFHCIGKCLKLIDWYELCAKEAAAKSVERMQDEVDFNEGRL
jgi:hypothetical protein